MNLPYLPPILVIEDSDDDFEATERALKTDGQLANPIVRCESGADALDYLFQRGAHDESSTPPPGLVLLDLNMPGVDGRAVLTAIKSNRETRMIPVVVLTTSDDEWDIKECYDAGANTYIKKPVGLDGFFSALHNLKSYWLQLAVLPRAL